MREQVDINVGDFLEAAVENGKITFTPKSLVHRRIIEGLEDLKTGRTHGPYATAEEAITALESRARRARTSHHIKHLRGPLWEMRMRGKDGIARAIYVTASGKRAVLLRVFIKKTQDTPNREIELAMKRAEEISE